MMKFSSAAFLLGALLYLSFGRCVPVKKTGKTKYRVSGSVMQTESYCGGAQPTPEMLKRFNTPTGIALGKLFVKEGILNNETTKIVDTIQADASGNFSINLPPGNYCLVEEWKSRPYKLPLNNEKQKVDSACYKNLYNTCDYELSISDKNIDSIKIIFHRTCFYNQPCIAYHGPLPPAAKPQ